MKKTALILLLLFASLTQWNARAQQHAALSTNLADYANAGTMNIEASYGFARHWSVNAATRYNPFELGAKQRAFSVGARWWPWYIYSGWWLSGAAQYQEYSTRGDELSEGDRYGGALSGGYSRMLGRHINLDLGMGVWAGRETYATYGCETCGRRTSEGEKAFLRAGNVTFALMYVF